MFYCDQSSLRSTPDECIIFCICTVLDNTLAGTLNDCKSQSFLFICFHTFCADCIIIWVLLIVMIIVINRYYCELNSAYRLREVTVRITVVQSTERGNNSLNSTLATLTRLQSDLYSQLLLVSNIQVIEIARYGW